MWDCPSLLGSFLLLSAEGQSESWRLQWSERREGRSNRRPKAGLGGIMTCSMSHRQEAILLHRGGWCCIGRGWASRQLYELDHAAGVVGCVQPSPKERARRYLAHRPREAQGVKVPAKARGKQRELAEEVMLVIRVRRRVPAHPSTQQEQFRVLCEAKSWSRLDAQLALSIFSVCHAKGHPRPRYQSYYTCQLDCHSSRQTDRTRSLGSSARA